MSAGLFRVVFMKKFSGIFVFLILFLSFFSVFAQKNPDDFSVVRKVSDGTLDFTSFELSVTGNGIPETNAVNLNSARITAEKAALLNAKRKTAKIILSLVLSGKTTVKAFFEGKGMNDFVEKLINDEDFREITYERFYSNSAVDVTYKVNISKYLQKIADAAAADLPRPEAGTAEKTENVPEKTKSLLLVNFKSKAEPALLMSLVDEKGTKIYDISMSSQQRKTPVSLFFAKKKADILIEKAGLSGETLAVQALKIKNGTEIVIKNSDAEKIRNELKAECFEEGRIVAVLPE